MLRLGARLIVLIVGIFVFTAIVRCGRDSHIQVTEQKVPNPALVPIQPHGAGKGDGFGPSTPAPDHIRGTRPAMPAIEPAPKVDAPVTVPEVIVPAIPVIPGSTMPPADPPGPMMPQAP